MSTNVNKQIKAEAHVQKILEPSKGLLPIEYDGGEESVQRN